MDFDFDARFSPIGYVRGYCKHSLSIQLRIISEDSSFDPPKPLLRGSLQGSYVARPHSSKVYRYHTPQYQLESHISGHVKK